MTIRKAEDDTWCLDFISKKIYFELGERILINAGAENLEEWIPFKVSEVRYNSDGGWLVGDDGTKEEHIVAYSCQYIIDARN